MTLIRIIDAFTFYGLDIIALSALTCILVQIAKVTFLKKFSKKIVTFMPAIIGTAVYAAYAGLINMSFEYLIQNYVDVLEHGFSIGALSTLVYVGYEQFIREKKTGSATQNVVETLIEGYIPDERLESTAQAICEALERDVTGSGAERIAAILNAERPQDVDEKDIKLLTRLIIETLAHINAVK